MQRLPPSLKAAPAAFVAPLLVRLTSLFVLLCPFAARAQDAPQPAACEAAERELEATRSALERALQVARSAQARASELEALQSALERIERERNESSTALEACRASKEELCTAAGGFARGLSAGQVNTGGLGACVEPNERRNLAEQLSGWANASSALARLGAFSSGESDAVPGLGPSSGSKIEKLVARLFAQGSGQPLVYRRLLVEALKQTAPRSFQALKAKPGSVERWFSSDEPLDAAIVAEAREGATAQSAGDGAPAPLTTAIGLVNAYQMLARCNGPAPARDCRRAKQLSQLLDSSGPLVALRRIQDVWAGECSSLTDDVMRRWLEDLPPARASEVQVEAVAQAVHSKLLTCFLRDATVSASFSSWLATKLPAPEALSAGALSRQLELERWWKPGSPVDLCARAVRALQTLPAPSECRAPPEFLAAAKAWSGSKDQEEAPAGFGFEVCDRLGRALWRGERATLPDASPAPPMVDDAVRLLVDAPPSNVARLRDLCADRVGRGSTFESSIRDLGRIARALGDNIALPPWNLGDALEPLESQRLERGEGAAPWLSSLARRNVACSLLELPNERCLACRDLPQGSRYDCALLQNLERSWSDKTRRLLLWGLFGAGASCLLLWALRLRRALSAHGAWLAQARSYLRSIGIEPRIDRLGYLFPSRLGSLQLRLPATPAWERWGSRAALVRSEGGGLQDRDVNRAGAVARAYGAELSLLVHEESASPDLGAVRSMLEWAARGAGKAVSVLPLSWNRLKWSRAASDLLELAEESSLRHNPFEVRGRVTSSTQFFDRERLVSGLLAGTQAGRFTVVTGLRRFGKSSLALEVARRLPGPSAYVDLAGFHHELRSSNDPADAADAILRFLCLTLLESARTRLPAAQLELGVPQGKLDTTTLSEWFREFGRRRAEHENGKPSPALLILDELEHAIGAARELTHALDVFAILVGRLRNSLPGWSQEGGQRVGVLFCSALHPLLWSPLGTLAHQSLIGSFEYVAVPCLPDEVAASMMRGLGSRQGIRFTDPALDLLVRESQSVPLLLRRLGTAVLELYDPERARQGGLGAVEIGVEGARAAIEREESEGSPLRVWIESEIAEPESPGGVVLRRLAQREHGSAAELRRLAQRAFRRQFEITGLALELTQGEAERRAEEAAAVVVRTLGDSGLLRAHGDPTEPEAYELPNGVIRRVLRGETLGS